MHYMSYGHIASGKDGNRKFLGSLLTLHLQLSKVSECLVTLYVDEQNTAPVESSLSLIQSESCDVLRSHCVIQHSDSLCIR